MFWLILGAIGSLASIIALIAMFKEKKKNENDMTLKAELRNDVFYVMADSRLGAMRSGKNIIVKNYTFSIFYVDGIMIKAGDEIKLSYKKYANRQIAIFDCYDQHIETIKFV